MACWGIATDYDEDARLSGLAQDESVSVIAEDSRQMIAQLPRRPLVFVGKSVGCIALMEAARLRPEARLIWMTPNLTHAPMRAAIASGRSFVIYGTEDPVTPPEEISRLSCPSHRMDGLDHALGGPDLAQPQQGAAQEAVRGWLAQSA